MNLKRRHRSFIENSVLSDLAFLLIIYFIVIAGFNVNEGFLIGLPKKDSVKIVERGDLYRFHISQNGEVFFGERRLDYAEAETELRTAVKERPDLAVVLTVAGEAPWQSVVSFIDLAQRSEASTFSFSMEKNSGEGAEP